MSLRLFIVADVRLYRDGLSATLSSRGPFAVVGSAATRAEARDAALALKADVVIVDMAVREALDLIRDLRQSSVATVVAFAVDEVAPDILRCAEAGAACYVTAEASLDELSAAIQGAVSGELRCSPRIAGELFRSLGRQAEAGAVLARPFLTSRERDVLNLVRQGLSNKEIGGALHLAESTVKNHVHHLLSKLEVRTRAQAAVRSLGRRKFASAARAKAHTG